MFEISGPGRLRALIAGFLVIVYMVAASEAAFAQNTVLEGSASVWKRKSRTRLSAPQPSENAPGDVPVSETITPSSTLTPMVPVEDFTAPPPVSHQPSVTTTIERPNWMPAGVSTTAGLVMETFTSVTFGGFVVSKKRAWRPPDRGYRGIKLHREIMNYWKPDCGPMYVNLVPYGPRGNFYFHHNFSNGPRGFMEYIGEGKNGFPNYRYWFYR